MKLRYSATSPFARKCVAVAIETGLDSRIELVPTLAWSADTDLPQDNPLCKIPALITDGGEALFDSPVICEYLDGLHDGHKLLPTAGGPRWQQLRLQALADGIMDAAVLAVVETLKRPEPLRWDWWLERQLTTVRRGLDALEQECPSWGDAFLIGQITAACALGYLDLRFAATPWRADRPNLTAWFDTVSARPSMVRSVPVE